MPFYAPECDSENFLAISEICKTPYFIGFSLHFQGGGPARNRTWTYGFGGHRPIHWTTGPCALRRRTKALPARFRLGKD